MGSGEGAVRGPHKSGSFFWRYTYGSHANGLGFRYRALGEGDVLWVWMSSRNWRRAFTRAVDEAAGSFGPQEVKKKCL